MPRRVTKIRLSTQQSLGQAYTKQAKSSGDLSATIISDPVAPWLAAITDLNGDGKAELIVGAPGNDASGSDAGRVYVNFGMLADGSTTSLFDPAYSIVINGATAGDRAGASVGSIGDLNGDGLSEILVGAPGMENGAAIDAGAAFVVWGRSSGGTVDLSGVAAGLGGGYVIKGAAAGDVAVQNAGHAHCHRR